MEKAQVYKNYKVVGGSDREQCECCGKMGLKKTVMMNLVGTDTIVHFGVVCAGNAEKYSTLEMAAEARKEIEKVMRAYEAGKKKAKKQSESDAEFMAKELEIQSKKQVMSYDEFLAMVNEEIATLPSIYSKSEKFKAMGLHTFNGHNGIGAGDYGNYKKDERAKVYAEYEVCEDKTDKRRNSDGLILKRMHFETIIVEVPQDVSGMRASDMLGQDTGNGSGKIWIKKVSNKVYKQQTQLRIYLRY